MDLTTFNSPSEEFASFGMRRAHRLIKEDSELGRICREWFAHVTRQSTRLGARAACHEWQVAA